MDCPRRFFLRYIKKQEWPAVETEPVIEQEKLTELGHQFHLLVQQSLSGMPREMIDPLIKDPDLLRWWNAFLQLDLDLSDSTYFAEEALMIPFAGQRLMAKFDLVIFERSGQALIYDWKTTHIKPTRDRFLMRAQSTIYPLVLAKAGTSLAGGSQIDPGKIEMRYWFPEFPDMTLSLPYSGRQNSRGAQVIEEMIREISARKTPEEFEKTEEQKICKYCRFRSLCERGIQAGENSEEIDRETEVEPNPFDMDIDL